MHWILNTIIAIIGLYCIASGILVALAIYREVVIDRRFEKHVNRYPYLKHLDN